MDNDFAEWMYALFRAWCREQNRDPKADESMQDFLSYAMGEGG